MKAIISDWNQDKKTIVVLYAVIQLFTLLILFFFPNPFLSIVFLASILILPFVITSPGNILLVLLLYISIFPTDIWGERYEFFLFYIDRKIVIALMVGIFGVLYIRLMHEKQWKLNLYFLDYLVFVFLVYAVFNAMWGWYNHGNITSALAELFYIILYSIYFPIRYLLNHDKQWLKKIFVFLLISATLAAAQYVFLTIINLDFKHIFINRVVTRQPHLAQLSIPILVNTFLFTKKKLYKIISLIAIIPSFLMVIFSQQRALWIGIILSIYIVLFFYTFRSNFKVAKIFKFLFNTLLVLALIIGFIVLADIYLNLHFVLTVAQRLSTLSDVSVDPSWQLRFREVGIALGKWKNDIFIGNGLGATYPNTNIGRNHTGIDNSYAYVLWKLGIWGALLFVSIYVTFLILGLKSYFQAKSVFDRIFISSSIAGMGGMMFIAITNMSLIEYQFNLHWAIVIAVIQHYYMKYYRN